MGVETLREDLHYILTAASGTSRPGAAIWGIWFLPGGRHIEAAI
jgi:hypothetical protein